MSKKHSYGLNWIDQDELYLVTQHVFKNVIKKAKEAELQASPDPFTIMSQAVLFDQCSDSMLEFERIRSINKSISNAIGRWHQSVLGLAEGWENLGNRGVVDLMVTEPGSGRRIAVEVKNRYNTIKASNEKGVWDELERLARVNRSKSYLVQIVPKTPERYDRPWKVSDRRARESVRCCDGATAYTWAFGVENALEELYRAFPQILVDVIGGSKFNDKGFFAFYWMSMPTA